MYLEVIIFGKKLLQRTKRVCMPTEIDGYAIKRVCRLTKMCCEITKRLCVITEIYCKPIKRWCAKAKMGCFATEIGLIRHVLALFVCLIQIAWCLAKLVYELWSTTITHWPFIFLNSKVYIPPTLPTLRFKNHLPTTK